MFRTVAMISFGVVFAGIFLHWMIFAGKGRARIIAAPFKRLGQLISNNISLWDKSKDLVFWAWAASFAVLLVTGFVPLILGSKLGGYLLMVHASFAPVFIGSAALYALLTAGRFCFGDKDLEVIVKRGESVADGRCWLTDSGLGAKIGFWFLLAMSLPVTLTMVCSMLPIFGPHGQEMLFCLHRWCSLVLALAGVLEIYMLARQDV